MLKQFTKLLKALNSGTKPEELALAVVIAMFAAFTLSPFNFLVWMVIMFVLAGSTAMFALMFVFFKIISLAIDPVCDIAGYAVLTAGPLQPFFIKLSAMPVAPFTRFNNTLVMGGFLVALAAAVPVWLGITGFIKYYRKNMAEKIEKAKIVRVLNVGGLIKAIMGDK